MPRRLFNWTFDDVVRFLKDNNFSYSYTEGSHYFYIGMINEEKRQVSVHFHGRKTIKPRTLKSIIAQSGIPQKKWLGGK